MRLTVLCCLLIQAGLAGNIKDFVFTSHTGNAVRFYFFICNLIFSYLFAILGIKCRLRERHHSFIISRYP